MTADPNGAWSQATDFIAGALATALGAWLLASGSDLFGWFLALLGPALILSTLNHRHARRQGTPSRAYWGVALALIAASAVLLALGHAALLAWPVWLQRVVVGLVCGLVPTALHAVLRLKTNRSRTWHNYGWTQVQLQAACVLVFCVFTLVRPALSGTRPAWLELGAVALASSGLALQEWLKRHPWRGPIDRNTLFHVFLLAALVTFFIALREWELRWRSSSAM
jgi:hypothetical protein